MDNKLISKAYTFAKNAHMGQYRKYTNESYIVHPYEVAQLVREYTDDSNVIAAALLHDTIEDCNVTYDDIKEDFGIRVADMVYMLTNDVNKINAMGKQEYMIKKLSLLDSNCLLIKLCDIYNNISDTKSKSQAYTYKTIVESLFTNNVPLNESHKIMVNNILNTYKSKFS